MMLSWANKQLERLAETIAPMTESTPAHRFMAALSKGDENTALAYLNGTHPESAENGPINPHEATNSSKGSQLIHIACQYCAKQVVLVLLNDHGARADTFDYQGNTALHYAATGKQTGSASPIEIVKMLVTDYNASVTVKNAESKTPYDVSTDTMVRQYLLPLQLQRETQECLDNGGQGLPPGIDLGGYKFHNNTGPPPPTNFTPSPTIVAPPQPSYAPPPTSYAPPPINTSTASTGPNPPNGLIRGHLNNPTAPESSINMSPLVSVLPHASPSPSGTTEAHFTAPPVSPYTNINNNAQQVISTTSPPIKKESQFTPPPLSGSLITKNTMANQSVTVAQNQSTPSPVASPEYTDAQFVDKSHSGISSQPDSTTSATKTAPVITSSEPESNVAGLSMPPPPISSESKADEANGAAFPQTQNTPKPSMSTMGVASNFTGQPLRTFRKADGFHSSSSDPNLQKKYGHIKTQVTVHQPPPTTAPGMMPPPPTMMSSSLHTRSQNRYLAYDAVTGTASSLQSKFPPPPLPSAPGSLNRYNGHSQQNAPPNLSVFNPASGS